MLDAGLLEQVGNAHTLKKDENTIQITSSLNHNMPIGKVFCICLFHKSFIPFIYLPVVLLHLIRMFDAGLLDDVGDARKLKKDDCQEKGH